MLTARSIYPKTENLCTTKWYWLKISDLLSRGELGDMSWSGDFNSDPLEWLKKEKLSSSHIHELRNSIAENGFEWAVCVADRYGRTKLLNGHHRVIVSISLGYEYVPATTDMNEDGYNDGYWLAKRG